MVCDNASCLHLLTFSLMTNTTPTSNEIVTNEALASCTLQFVVVSQVNLNFPLKLDCTNYFIWKEQLMCD